MNIMKTSALFVLFLSIFSVSSFAQKMKAEDVLAKHLESIGTAETRASIKSRIAVGDAVVKFISQKNQTSQGRIVLASTGEKNFFGMNLNSLDYQSEKFSFDGKKAKVGFVRAGTRSILGNFVLTNNILLEASLLAGTLSTSWALLDMADKKAKLSFDGTKKIDGKEVYAIGYSAKNGGDIDITLYFDKQTFRHVRSEYKRISSAGIGTSPDQSSRFSETRLKVTEDFSDFKDEKGLTLPHNYRIFYSIAGQGGTTEIEWQFNLTEFAFNQKITDNTFDAEAN
ncbi:MAG: hypothetical protein ACR2MG_18310 [Pyrinomonadaceae bacterium]